MEALAVAVFWHKQRSLERDPRHMAEAHAILAEACAALGDMDSASANIDTATAMLTSQTDPAVSTETWIHLQATQLEVYVYIGDIDSIKDQLKACKTAIQQSFGNDLGSIRQALCAAYEA